MSQMSSVRPPTDDGRLDAAEPTRPVLRADHPPLPGQAPLIAAALAIGILLLGIQLWLLTVALDLYLAGTGSEVWLLALGSGAIFGGGVLVIAVLHRRPTIRRPSGDEAPYAVGSWGSPGTPR